MAEAERELEANSYENGLTRSCQHKQCSKNNQNQQLKDIASDIRKEKQLYIQYKS